MRHERARLTAVLIGAGCLGSATLLAGPAPAQDLGTAMKTRAQANEESVQSQARIDQVSDQTDELLARYRTTTKQIEALRIYNRQLSELIDSQEIELASLRDQIDSVELVSRGVTPLMLRMIDAIEAFVTLDVPFLMAERAARVANLREMMARSDVTNSEKYRRITEAYQIENEYGRTIEAYRGTIDNTGQERTVDFLRMGRIALVYQTLDGSEAGVWNQQQRIWEELDSSYRSAISQGLRVARKQSAPEMIRLPIPAATRGGQS